MDISKKAKITGGLTAAAVLAAIGVGVTVGVTGATGSDDSSPITGTALERASAAALASTGGGRVTETEIGDEESLYEVEVTLDDGSRVDVQLDADFNVVGSKSEPGETADDADGDHE